MTDQPQNLDTMKLADIEGIDIVEWHPLPDGRGKPTQVHMLLKLQGIDAQLVMRFKGRHTLDKVVAALNEHADAVFGKAKS